MGLKSLMILGLGMAFIGGQVAGTRAAEDTRGAKTQDTQWDVKTLAKHIGYTFRDASYLDKVFSHTGVAPTNQLPFGRLEFLGDGVLEWVVTRRLMDANPTQGEGWLTEKKATIVSNENNAAVFDRLQLFPFVRHNPVHKINGEGLKKIKADTCEALIGAICLDGGQESAEKFIVTYWLSNAPTNGLSPVVSNGASNGVIKPVAVKAAVVVPAQAKITPMPPTVVLKAQAFKVVGDVKTQLEAFRLAHNLPSPTYKWTSKKAPFRGQLHFCDLPFTAAYEGSSKSAVKKLCAAQVLRKFDEARFSETLKGKSKQEAVKLLRELAAQTMGLSPKAAQGVKKVAAAPKAPVAPKASAVSAVKVVPAAPAIPVVPVTKAAPAVFSETVSVKKAKQRLQDLCVHLHEGDPVYTVLEGATTSTASVTIEGVGTFEVLGNKTQKHAALAAYTKITGKVIGLKQVRKALTALCQERHFGKPVYTSGKMEVRVQVAAGALRAEAVSDQSQVHAEKEAARKLYEALRKARM
jgi:dsRNA-specific ribonuclease